MAEQKLASTALRARGLSASLDGKRVLHEIDFETAYGSVLAVLGPNGAGKTTLLRALAGLLPYSGAIEIDGVPQARLDRRELARRLAFVPQRTQLNARLPVGSVVGHGRYAHRGGLARLTAQDHAAVERALALADVTHLVDRDLPDLSYGEQRRVLLARALASEARILLLDEPTASLDIPHALGLYATLRALAGDGRAVVLVLHQLDDALRYADRCLLLRDGERVAEGPSAELIRSAELERVYGVRVIEGGALGFERLERMP